MPVKKVLIVDDEKLSRDYFVNIIDWSEYGFSCVHTAADGLEVYDKVLENRYDLILTDIRMPGINGLDLIKKIQQIPHNPLFIIMSGYSEFEYAQTAMRLGVKYYLLKPVEENEGEAEQEIPVQEEKSKASARKRDGRKSENKNPEKKNTEKKKSTYYVKKGIKSVMPHVIVTLISSRRKEE